MTDKVRALHLRQFSVLYALANIGTVVAFIPLLSLILPLKAAHIDQENKLLLLSIALCVGAICASLANIAAGWLSDQIVARYGHRFGQIGTGLVAILISYILFWQADSWTGLVFAIIIFQCSLNLLYSPMTALLADYIPHEMKGRISAFLNLGIPIGSFSITILTLMYIDSEAARLGFVAALIIGLISPLLIFSKSRKIPLLTETASAASNLGTNIHHKPHQGLDVTALTDLRWAWIARFSIQFSGAVLFGYTFYFVQDIIGYADIFPHEKADTGVGKLNLLATPVAIGTGLIIGYYSDRIRMRRPFLITSALCIALALITISIWPYWSVTLMAFALFSAGLTSFLSIDGALVTQILMVSKQRAQIMGYMNLTNTLPAILTPALAIILSSNGLPEEVLRILIILSAVFSLMAILAVSRIKTIR